MGGGEITQTSDIFDLIKNMETGTQNTSKPSVQSVPNQTGADKRVPEETGAQETRAKETSKPSVWDETGVGDRVQQETGAQEIPEISVVGTFTSTHF